MNSQQRRDVIEALGVDMDVQVGELGEGYLCACGCKEKTSFGRKGWSTFRPGHDARLVGRALKMSRDQVVDINHAIALLEELSPALANKLRQHWLRVTPQQIAAEERKTNNS